MKKHEDLIKKATAISRATHEFSKEIPKTKAPDTEPQTKVLKKEILRPDIKKIVPTGGIKAPGKLTPERRAEYEYDWEYVEGILENNICPGEGLSFNYLAHPGDKYCRWDIPVGVPVSIPRFIARHLAENLKYHVFKEKKLESARPDDFAEKIEVAETKQRSKFRPLDAFA